MSTEIRKYAYIDLVRGLAVLGVVAAHVREYVDSLMVSSILNLSLYCQMGVQLFFVASALTLCLSMRSRSGDKSHLIGYTLRRFFRIAPLYYVAIAVYFCLGNAEIRSHYDLKNLLGNVLFLHGLLPFIYSGIVLGGWSIGTEMLFYVIFPSLFKIMTSLRRSTAACLVYLGSLAYVVMLTRAGYLSDFHVPNNQFVYFNILVQLPAFLAGIAAYHVIQKRQDTISSWTIAGTGITSLLLGVGAWHSPFMARFLVVPGLFGIAFAALTILLSRQSERSMATLPAKIIQELGKKSYAIYLFHFPFAWTLWPKWFHPSSIPWPPLLVLALGIVFVVIPSYVVAWIAGRLIEEPGIALGKWLISRLPKSGPVTNAALAS